MIFMVKMFKDLHISCKFSWTLWVVWDTYKDKKQKRTWTFWGTSKETDIFQGKLLMTCKQLVTRCNQWRLHHYLRTKWWCWWEDESENCLHPTLLAFNFHQLYTTLVHLVNRISAKLLMVGWLVLYMQTPKMDVASYCSLFSSDSSGIRTMLATS